MAYYALLVLCVVVGITCGRMKPWWLGFLLFICALTAAHFVGEAIKPMPPAPGVEG